MIKNRHSRDCDWQGSYNPTTGRPGIDFEVLGINGKNWQVLDVLVDSGADYIQMPQSMAVAIGLPAGVPHPVITASGHTHQMYLVTNQQVVVEARVTITADILLDTTNTAPPLFGRQAMQSLKQCGFGPANWGTKD